MKKWLIGILALATAALGVLCVRQSRELRAQREQAQAAEVARRVETDTRQAQAARVKELERVNAQLDQQVRQFTAVTTSLRTNEAQQSSQLSSLTQKMQAMQAKPGVEGAGGKGGLFGKDMGKMLGTLMKDPAMKEMMRDQQKSVIHMMYGSLFKELNLTPEEKEKFKSLLTDAQMKNIEFAPGLLGGRKEGAEDTNKLLADAKKQTDADVKALLGDERFAQYEEYQKSMGERMQLDQFKTRMAAENLPLQDQQVAQLFQAMKEEKAAVPPVIPTDNTQAPKKEMFTAGNLEKQMAWMEDYNRRVAGRAGQILSPEQLQQYLEWQQQQASMQKLGLDMARQMFGGDKPADAEIPAAK